MDVLKNRTCVIFKGENEVYATSKRGIAPLLQLIQSKTDVENGIAYDKIVGRAAAFLYVLLRVAKVHAEVMSVGGKQVLESCGICAECDVLAEKIINRKGDGVCPMEAAVQHTNDPNEALQLLAAKVAELQ